MRKANQLAGTAIEPGELSIPVAADAVISKGDLVAVNSSGYLVVGSEVATLIAVGRAEENVDNTGGSNGALRCRVKRGVFAYANSESGDAIVQADLFKVVYIVDGGTVAKTDDDGGRSAAGVFFGFADDGKCNVYVGHPATLVVHPEVGGDD